MFNIGDKVKLSNTPSKMTQKFYDRFPEYINNNYTTRDAIQTVVFTEKLIDGMVYYLKDIPWAFIDKDLEALNDSSNS